MTEKTQALQDLLLKIKSDMIARSTIPFQEPRSRTYVKKASKSVKATKDQETK